MKEERTCQNCKSPFTIEDEDFDFYKKIQVPPPTWCPECRLIRRLTFRSERSLFKDRCDLCGKDMISMYSPEKPFRVYCNSCWFSDKWDAIQYGKAYDFSRPFFTQFAELVKEVPRMALEAYQNENSPYSNFTWLAKNVYLSPSTMYSENISFCFSCWHSTDLLDCYCVEGSNLGYEILQSNKCSNCIYLLHSLECIDSSFLFDCRNCQNCFMCSNLRNRSNCFRNEQLSPEEYKKKISEIDSGSYATLTELIREYKMLCTSSLRKYATTNKVENVSGDILVNAKNSHFCFNGTDIENVKYGAQLFKIKDSMDIYGAGPPGELLYEGVNVGYKDSSIYFSAHTFEGMTMVQYCDYCRLTDSNLFGCAGLRKKAYCILNKQYTKEEYETLLPKIKKHMEEMPYVDSKGRIYKYGEFFPPDISPFAYNETIAQEFFPLKKEEAIFLGYQWRDPDERNYQISISVDRLPDRIMDVKDDIINEVIQCSHGGKCLHQCTEAFKVIPEELAFYRRMNLPIPRLCPNCRHYERLSKRNPLRLWHRKCMCNQHTRLTDGQATDNTQPTTAYQNTAVHEHGDKPCPNEFETSYAPERPEIVYCESCYQQEVI